MHRLYCTLTDHAWRHVCNAAVMETELGLYQCRRCAEVRLGRPRDPAGPDAAASNDGLPATRGCRWGRHDWVYVFDLTIDGQDRGLYQCRRCRALAPGRRRRWDLLEDPSLDAPLPWRERLLALILPR